MRAPLPGPVVEILREAQIVRLATVTPERLPHAAPFWFAFDGERIVLDTLENATVRNLRRNDRVALVFDLGTRFEELRGAIVHGRARAYAEREAPAPVAAAIEALRAAHADEIASPEFQELVSGETRPLVYVEILPERASSFDFRLRG